MSNTQKIGIVATVLGGFGLITLATYLIVSSHSLSVKDGMLSDPNGKVVKVFLDTDTSNQITGIGNALSDSKNGLGAIHQSVGGVADSVKGLSSSVEQVSGKVSELQNSTPVFLRVQLEEARNDFLKYDQLLGQVQNRYNTYKALVEQDPNDQNAQKGLSEAETHYKRLGVLRDEAQWAINDLQTKLEMADPYSKKLERNSKKLKSIQRTLRAQGQSLKKIQVIVLKNQELWEKSTTPLVNLLLFNKQGKPFLVEEGIPTKDVDMNKGTYLKDGKKQLPPEGGRLIRSVIQYTAMESDKRVEWHGKRVSERMIFEDQNGKMFVYFNGPDGSFLWSKNDRQ